MRSMKMVELRLRELRDFYYARSQSEVGDHLDAVIDEITESDGAILEIDDAQILPKGTLLASTTESYIKSYPDVTHPWKTSAGRVLSDQAMNKYIEAREVALYRYGSGLDHEGNPT